MSKNYNEYAYFISRAKNLGIVIRPDKKKIVDGEVVFDAGLRVEFNNGMLALKKSKENEKVLAILRDKIAEEQDLDPRRRTFWEEMPPKEMVDAEKVEEVLAEALTEKNIKIKELEDELKKLKKQ